MIAGMAAAAALARWAHGWQPVEVVGVVPRALAALAAARRGLAPPARAGRAGDRTDDHRARAVVLDRQGADASVRVSTSTPTANSSARGCPTCVGGFFSCFLSCGSLNRSLPNLEAGARTPLASRVLGAVAAGAGGGERRADRRHPDGRRVGPAAAGGMVAARRGAVAPAAAAVAAGVRHRAGHAGRHAGDPPGTGDPVRHDAVAGRVPVAHRAAGDAHDGLRHATTRAGRS